MLWRRTEKNTIHIKDPIGLTIANSQIKTPSLTLPTQIELPAQHAYGVWLQWLNYLYGRCFEMIMIVAYGFALLWYGVGMQRVQEACRMPGGAAGAWGCCHATAQVPPSPLAKPQTSRTQSTSIASLVSLKRCGADNIWAHVWRGVFLRVREWLPFGLSPQWHRSPRRNVLSNPWAHAYFPTECLRTQPPRFCKYLFYYSNRV